MSSFLKNPTVQIVAGYFPKLSTIILAVVCFALGMIWAYGIQPVQYFDGSPAQLEQSFQDQWVLGAAGRYASRNSDDFNGNVLGMLRSVDNPQAVVDSLQNNPEFQTYVNSDPNYAAAFGNLVAQAQEQAPPPPPRPSPINNYLVPLIVLLVFAVLLVLGKVLWTLLVFPFIEPLIARGRDTSDSKAEIDRIKEQRALEAEMKADVSTNDYGEAIIRKASLYKSGFGTYDDSFNIETEDKTYYGEAGVTISEKIDDGVTAIEVWMFDKDEFANTPTAIFATEHAFNDPTLRSRLDAKGEVIKLEKGNKAVLETNGLFVEAIVRDVNYKADAAAPQSIVDSSTIQINAWSKSAGGSTPAPAAPAMPAAMPAAPAAPSTPPTTPQPLAPPPLNPDAMPGFGQPQPPAAPPANPQPLQPPPMGDPFAPPPPNPRPPADDPFGGAGDFTPVNPND